MTKEFGIDKYKPGYEKKMRIYRLASQSSGSKYAMLRPLDFSPSNPLSANWEDWGGGGREVGDFVFCYGVPVCREKVYLDLRTHFAELSAHPIEIIPTEKELQSKHPQRLKWLPQASPPLCVLSSSVEADALPQSTFRINDRGMITIEGIAELRGGSIIPRTKGKGLFISNKSLDGVGFFYLKGSGVLFCSEEVKLFCEQQKYANLLFLEVGELIDKK